MTKEELLQELSAETYVTLKPSPVHGIGVFALCAIPKGCKTIFSRQVGNWIKVPIADIEKLPAHSRNLVETYCLYDEQDYYLPDYGFKVMDLVNYLNHSAVPNLISVNDGEYFESLREIAEGEELFVNYGEIVDTKEYDQVPAT
jgi:SET domain-containing protein